MKIIESFTGFQPLEEVWIGGVYPEKFYQHLPNQVEDAFCKITEMTNKTFDQLNKKLTELGITVHRPLIEDNIDLYMDDQENLIKPPVCPRDWAITLGNQLLIINQGYKKEPFQHVIDQYQSQGADVQISTRYKKSWSWLSFPSIVRIGTKLIVEISSTKNKNYNYFTQKTIDEWRDSGYQVEITQTGGHSDAVFCPIRQGHIFSSHWGDKNIYQKTLPGWEIFWLPDTTKKRKRNGRWWQQQDNWKNPAFNKYVQEYAKEWIGDSRETIFEVNMLVVDDKNVICIAEDDTSLKKMESMGIKGHVIDFPTRSFWDGAMHCVTLDIRRRGGKINYFNTT